jgi:hypothetical protein
MYLAGVKVGCYQCDADFWNGFLDMMDQITLLYYIMYKNRAVSAGPLYHWRRTPRLTDGLTAGWRRAPLGGLWSL